MTTESNTQIGRVFDSCSEVCFPVHTRCSKLALGFELSASCKGGRVARWWVCEADDPNRFEVENGLFDRVDDGATAVVVLAMVVVGAADVLVVFAALGVPLPQAESTSRVTTAVRIRTVRMPAKVWPGAIASERAQSDLDDSRRVLCLNPDGYRRWRTGRG
jgi:hypothetical protein